MVFCVMQIVRSTEQYQRLLETVPSVFVGTPSALTDLVEFMVARMEDSFLEQGMCCPPWRQVRSPCLPFELSFDEKHSKCLQHHLAI